jgi:hypothetical protein
MIIIFALIIVIGLIAIINIFLCKNQAQNAFVQGKSELIDSLSESKDDFHLESLIQRINTCAKRSDFSYALLIFVVFLSISGVALSLIVGVQNDGLIATGGAAALIVCIITIGTSVYRTANEDGKQYQDSFWILARANRLLISISMDAARRKEAEAPTNEEHAEFLLYSAFDSISNQDVKDEILYFLVMQQPRNPIAKSSYGAKATHPQLEVISAGGT